MVESGRRRRGITQGGRSNERGLTMSRFVGSGDGGEGSEGEERCCEIDYVR